MKTLTLALAISMIGNVALAAPSCVVFKGHSNSKGRGELSTYPENQPIRGHLIWNLRMDNVLENDPIEPVNDPYNYTPAYAIYNTSSPSANIGVGHALKFADNAASLNPEGIVIIPCGKGGAKMTTWAPSLSTSTLWGACLARVNLAKSMTNCEIKLVVYMIGDKDAREEGDANGVKTRFEQMIVWDRAYMEPGVPVVYHQLGDLDPEVADSFPYWETVKAQFAAVNKPAAWMLPTEGYPKRNDDHIHFTTAGQLLVASGIYDLVVRRSLIP